MLCDFFRINLPYGLFRNDRGEWMAFNREYQPLGYSKREYGYDNECHEEKSKSFEILPIYAKYRGMTDRFLLELVGDEKFVKRDEKGKICQVFFYNDETNPMKCKNSSLHWESYWRKMEKISKLMVIK